MSNLAKKVIEQMTDKDKSDLKSWAEDAFIIKNDQSLSRNEKIRKLTILTNKSKVSTKFIKSFFKLIKYHSWDERGWPARLALTGLTSGLVLGGSKMAGIASAGFGVGVPLYLLSSAGGALLGTIISEIKKG